MPHRIVLSKGSVCEVFPARRRFTLKGDNHKLSILHHKLLLGILGAWFRSQHQRTFSYDYAIQRTSCEGGCTGGFQYRLILLGAMRLPCWAMLVQLENPGRRRGWAERGGKEKEWADCLMDELRVFCIGRGNCTDIWGMAGHVGGRGATFVNRMDE